MKERKYNLDLMRIVLSICVIILHSYEHFGFDSDVVNAFIITLLITCDGLFYMISGYFNLEKEFRDGNDILKFYKSKFITVMLPFMAFVFVWNIWDYVHETGSFNLIDIMFAYYKALVDTSAEGYLWFMYPLFGMLLSTPFLSKMLHNMDDEELKILWRVAIGINAFAYYFCWDLEIDFAVMAWFLEGWAIYYFAGYYYRHVIVKEKKIKWIILAIVGYVFTMLGNYGLLPFFSIFAEAYSLQPMFTFLCIGCLMFWDQVVKIKNKVLIKIIAFLASNTYMVYLFHTRGIEYAVRKLPVSNDSIGSGLLITFGAYVVSLLLAYIANLCLKPIQNFLRKIWLADVDYSALMK